MSKVVKILILVLVLLLPAAIFVFLGTFGENKFDVAIQHPEGLRNSDCPDYGAPHKVPKIDSLDIGNGNYQLFYLQQDDLSKDNLNELRRVISNHPAISFYLFLQIGEDKTEAIRYKGENWQINVIENDILEELNRCVFGNTDELSLILLDPERHVRGYYDIFSKKELDRLEGEIAILMK